MEDVTKTLDLFDDNEILRGYTSMIKLYNALQFITMLIFINKILRLNLGVAFLKSVSIITCCMLYRRSKAFKSLCFLFNVGMPSLNKISYLILSYSVDNVMS